MECIICKNTGEKIVIGKSCLTTETIHDIISCPKCGAMYFSPMPSVLELSKFYSNSYYNFDKYKDEHSGGIYAKKLKKIAKTGNFLDIGCSTGHFIKGIKDKCEWGVFGTEFSASMASYAREKLGLDVRKGDLKDAGFSENYFDYIHMNNVLEHVTDPVSFLNEIFRVLKPGGNFQLLIPNGEADAALLQRFYEEEKVPAKSKDGHLFFFPKKALINLLEKTGFKIKKTKTCSISRGLRVFGLLSLKKNWKDAYRLTEKNKTEKKEITSEEAKKRSGAYYAYRYFMNNSKNIPGLHSFGLDFLI
ncbi:MAG: class I SAM-dependent methyltransferase, partial [Candidatus Firestonebacteria bacterium]